MHRQKIMENIVPEWSKREQEKPTKQMKEAENETGRKRRKKYSKYF